MELVKIQTQTSWGDAVNGINSNNQEISVELRKIRNIANKNLGYFTSVEDLKREYPTASNGSVAFVGTSYPYKIFEYKNTMWLYSGENGGSNVDLPSYLQSQPITDITEILDTI